MISIPVTRIHFQPVQNGMHSFFRWNASIVFHPVVRISSDIYVTTGPEVRSRLHSSFGRSHPNLNYQSGILAFRTTHSTMALSLSILSRLHMTLTGTNTPPQ